MRPIITCLSLMCTLALTGSVAALLSAKRPLVTGLYRTSLAQTRGVFFHNEDDLAEFKNRAIVDQTQNLIRVHGSGVDIDRFSPTNPPKRPLIFLLIARLLVDKGIREYVAAARQIRARHPSVKFQLIGPPDTTPSAIQEA